ncbi:MAG TPA: beta-ketoacyl-ACP synthase II [Bdellovibrionales bacterium]|nr:beta-ketoacyl-ACP synthase II [Bdellovibrionales bacterium]
MQAFNQSTRVVITGMGLVSPIGASLEASWLSLIEGRSGIAPIASFDHSALKTHIAGEARDFDPMRFISPHELKKTDRFVQMAIGAAQMAVDDSGLDWRRLDHDRMGAIVGSGMGGLPYLCAPHEKLLQGGPRRGSPFYIPSVIANIAAATISMRFDLRGPNYCITSACSSGAHAIVDGARWLRSRECDVMIVGGSESVMTPLSFSGFQALGALSTRNECPREASRPWDEDRDGFVIGEGAGIMILENFEHAQKRGAKIYGELLGFGVTSDAHHQTKPAPDGEGAARAINKCLNSAGIEPTEIDYVNAHGTGTEIGDLAETAALKASFGDHANKLWISSNKSMIGHTMGAAGAIESVFALKTLSHGIVPATINLDRPGEGCDLDYVPRTAREKSLRYVLKNSFGFGGVNVSILFSRV